MAGATLPVLLAVFALLLQTGRVECGDEESAFFRASDANGDGLLSKKEFYTAVMDEGFELIAERHGFSAVDMEFTTIDLDGNKRISSEEWDTVFWALETADAEPEPKEEEPANEWQAEEDFFAMADTDAIGFLRKREFYNALMSDPEGFELISSKKDFSAVDMDFAVTDTNNDGKVTKEEWMAVFFHGLPQKPLYADGRSTGQASTERLVESDSTDLVGPGGPWMRIKSEMDAPGVERYFFGEDISWMQANEYCSDRRYRLCSMEELCPKVQENLQAERRAGLFAPISGKEHHWADLPQCGRAKKVADKRHSGVVACCSLTPPPMRTKPVHALPKPAPEPAREAAVDPPAEPAADGGVGAAAVADDAGAASLGVELSEEDSTMLWRQKKHGGGGEVESEGERAGAAVVESALWGDAGALGGGGEVEEMLKMQQELHAKAGQGAKQGAAGGEGREEVPPGDGGAQDSAPEGAVEAAAHSVGSAEERLQAESADVMAEPPIDAAAEQGDVGAEGAVEAADLSSEAVGGVERGATEGEIDVPVVGGADDAVREAAEPRREEAPVESPAAAAQEVSQEQAEERVARKEKKKGKKDKKAKANAAEGEQVEWKKEKKSKKEKREKKDKAGKKERKEKKSAERVLVEEHADAQGLGGGEERPTVAPTHVGAWEPASVAGDAGAGSSSPKEKSVDKVNSSRGGKADGGFPEVMGMKDESARVREAQEEIPTQKASGDGSWSKWASSMFGSGSK